MLVMMALDGALAGGAARGGIRGPCGCGKRREEQHDCKQADDCLERATGILMPSGHGSPNLPKSYSKQVFIPMLLILPNTCVKVGFRKRKVSHLPS
jgi:hypothetical protein